MTEHPSWADPLAVREAAIGEAPESKLDLGPHKAIHAFWLAGMSCDGCSIGVVGATSPSAEMLMAGTIPGVPKVLLHHPVLAVEAGAAFVENYRMAERGELGAPYVVIFEGSVPDERLAGKNGGYWSALGADETADGGQEPIPTASWLERLAPNAAAVIAVGTCATWGGIPAAAGNPTGAMGVMDFLGADYRSDLGLPVVNIPGCSPVGDNVTETIAAVLLFLQGLGPLPEFDELGRPAWLFEDTVHRHCVRAGFYEEGTFADHYGGKECLVEIGCWGPVVQCNIAERGAIGGMGGCMNAGGICIGCTMPGFPDRFAPFYQHPPGSYVSTGTSRLTGTFVRALRGLTQEFQNRSTRWEGDAPSGWGHVKKPNVARRALHEIYEKMQFLSSPKPGSRREEEKR